MKSEETVELIDYIRLMFPTQRMEDETPDVWHDALRSLTLGECRKAVASLATRQRFVATAEIHAEVRVMRAAVPVPSFGGGEQWRRCPWTVCRCTHDGPCVKGWIDTDDGVRPCPTCRPEVAQHLNMAGDPRLAREELRWLPRPSRRPPS